MTLANLFNINLIDSWKGLIFTESSVAEVQGTPVAHTLFTNGLFNGNIFY